MSAALRPSIPAAVAATHAVSVCSDLCSVMTSSSQNQIASDKERLRRCEPTSEAACHTHLTGWLSSLFATALAMACSCLSIPRYVVGRISRFRARPPEPARSKRLCCKVPVVAAAVTLSLHLPLVCCSDSGLTLTNAPGYL